MSDHTRVHVWEQEKARAAACLLWWAEISAHVSGSVPMSLRLTITGVQPVWPLKTGGCEPRHGRRRRHSKHLLLKKGHSVEMGLQAGHELVHTVHVLWSSQSSNYFPDLLSFSFFSALLDAFQGFSDHLVTAAIVTGGERQQVYLSPRRPQLIVVLKCSRNYSRISIDCCYFHIPQVTRYRVVMFCLKTEGFPLH